MNIDNRHASTSWQEPGYIEGSRSTGNRSFTDYAQDVGKDDDDRIYGVYKDRRK